MKEESRISQALPEDVDLEDLSILDLFVAAVVVILLYPFMESSDD